MTYLFKKFLLPVMAILFVFSNNNLNAQQIQNVKAAQSGSNVVVTYDLNDQSGKPYYVKLLTSKDGVNFGDELKYVTGDVKNTKAGLGKKIIWNAAQEISYYDGSLTFRVEATVKAAPLPEPIEQQCAKVELINVKGNGGRVTVDFLVTAMRDQNSFLGGANQSSLIDLSGNHFNPSGGKFGDTQFNNNKAVLTGIPVKSQLFFDNISSDATSIALLTIFVYGSNDGNNISCSSDWATFKFRNVPITR